jgi:Flp pilus assembly protein TadG
MAGGPFVARRARPLTTAKTRRSCPANQEKREPPEFMNNRAAIRSERGQSMTEFALVLPLLVVLLFGIIQFGITFNNYISLTDAVRAGARKATTSRHANDPVAVTIDQVRRAATDLDPADLQVSVESSWNPYDDVKVTASYPYSIKLLGVTIKEGRMNSATTERVEP